METDEKNIRIGLDEMEALVLEALMEYSSRLDEGSLNGAVGDVRRMLELFRNNPEEFDRMAASGVDNAYSRLRGAVKGILSRHGIQATAHDPITGRPNVETTSSRNRRMAMQDTVSRLRSRITALIPGSADWLPDNADDSSRFMKPTVRDGRLGLACRSVGELSRLIASMDGKGVSVEVTDRNSYGDGAFTETRWFISLPDPDSGNPNTMGKTGQTA